MAGARGQPRVRAAAQQVDIRPMAAPKFSPVDQTEPVRGYESPDHVPDGMDADAARGDRRVPAGGPASRRPGTGPGLRVADRQHLAPEGPGRPRGERRRRDRRLPRGGTASGVDLLAGPGRARPDHRVHDLGLLRLVAARRAPRPAARRCSKGCGSSGITTPKARAVVDMVPEATLRMTPEAVTSAFPGEWRNLLGA